MNTSKRHNFPARLEGVRRRFERWRRGQSVRSRIPDPLWAAAVKMARSYGICRTARALRVDYYGLKKRIDRESAAAPDLAEGGAVATFIEVAAAASAGCCECTWELEDAGGKKMRVHLKGLEAPDLAALSRSFWNPAP
jgi:hypothetical protein